MTAEHPSEGGRGLLISFIKSEKDCKEKKLAQHIGPAQASNAHHRGGSPALQKAPEFRKRQEKEKILLYTNHSKRVYPTV